MAVNANTDIADKAINRAALIRLYERRLNDKVSVIIDGHEVKVAKLVANANLNEAGFRKLRDSVDLQIQRSFKEVYNTTKRSLLDLFSDQVSYAYQNVETVMGKIWRTSRPERRIAEEIVLEKPLYSNTTLSQGWSRIGLSERKRIEALIRKGISEGKTSSEIALLIRKGNIHNITRAQSKALVITATTSVYAQADHAVYKANGKALRGWQYIAVLDSRTTTLCAHRDGQIYDISQTEFLPPAHFNCRSTTIPVFKSWEDLSKLEGVSQIRQRNLKNLSKKDIAYYDGQTPLRETYNQWLSRQPQKVKLQHLGDYQKVQLLDSGKLTVEKFVNPEGNSIGIKELRRMSDSGYDLPNDTRRFALAKEKLDAMKLYATSPDDFIRDTKLKNTLVDYYLLQSQELDGTLSLTNYRGTLLGVKKGVKNRVLTSPPREDQLKFNPITGRYEDVRLYQPNTSVLNNNLRLIAESQKLKDSDKEFINSVLDALSNKMGANERAVIADNLRIVFSRYRDNPEPWANFKAVSQAQIKFDVMNVSDAIETQIRKDSDLLKKLTQDNYIDPVLGPVQLQDLHDNFIKNILSKNNWEDKIAPKIALELRSIFDTVIARKNPIIWNRVSDRELQQFYLKFANRLSLADSPDRDSLAVSLGRDLYNLANLNGNRRKWYELGLAILEDSRAEKFYKVETFGVQKRRMKSRLSGAYFGPYYDTLSYNIRIVDPRIQEYSRLTRKVDLGLRVSVKNDKNRLIIRKGYKTYFIDRGFLGLEDSRIPITSTSSFSDFPEELVDDSLADALNWAGQTKYKIDKDYYDFINKLLYFEDDKGNAKLYNELNEYRKFIASRGDAYERFKTMEWLRKDDSEFSNHAFVDHRARIYDRGLISPQAGETFRPFLNTNFERNFSELDFKNFKDQIGSFLGGLNDKFEGNYNSLSITGRQKIADYWRSELVRIGNHMLRGKPADIRAVLENQTAAMVDGEELGKFYRFAIESAKIDNFLNGDYSKKSLQKLSEYKTSLALEQDASSSGAQIIALTTRNKQLAELSNVVPTNQKRRLYDEIAASTYNDPRFRELNKKLGLTEKDLRKAAKAQNMVTFYGAGDRTGVFNVEGKLAKVLNKQQDVLVVKAADRDTVLNEISARIARYERFDQDTANELRALREDVKDVFNKGLDPGDEILDQLYFLEPKTRELVEKMSMTYEKVVTPNDFKQIAMIMSENLREQVPILKEFTRFFGRLAEDYLANSKPSKSDFEWSTILKTAILGSKKKGYTLSDTASRLLGLKAKEPLSEKILKRFGFWEPNSTLADIIYGVKAPTTRKTGGKYLKFDIAQVKDIYELEILYANKMPKRWTNVPWVNFDGKIIEQNFTQTFEERLLYRDKDGNWVNNILQVPQKTESTWWEQIINKSGKINDIADATKARTAFAVNGNHSNDAVLVKKFHLWGKKENIPTSTVHDAFFTNAADMLKARSALRKMYSDVLDNNVIIMTLDEMKARGLPSELYNKYLNEAIELGLIPVENKSVIGGKRVKKSDILRKEDILKSIDSNFESDYGWYGVG